MARFHHIVSGIILLTLLFPVGIVCAADGDSANLSVSKVVSSDAPYETGQPVTWVVTLWNNGPANATNISLSESISGFSGQVDMNGVADQGTYDNSTMIWNISKLDNATSSHLTIVTVFDTEGTQTNNVEILRLDQTSHENRHADATVVINNAAAVIPDQPLSVNLAIRPTTLNLKSKGVFTVYVTLAGFAEMAPDGNSNKPRIDYASSSLTCSEAEMIRASVSNKDGGTLIAKFHRQDLENVTAGNGVQINCSGTLSVNGETIYVEGSDTIRVIGEKSEFDKIFSQLWKFLGISKDDVEITEEEDGNVTLMISLNPDDFRNFGQVKKTLKAQDTESAAEADNETELSDETLIVKEKGKPSKNNGNTNQIKVNNANIKSQKGNNSANERDDESAGKSNGKNK